MQQFGKFAIGLAALVAVGFFINERWGDSFGDPPPAAKQLREQFEAIETSAGLPVDHHGCRFPRQFVASQPFFYECPVSAPQLAALRPVLATRGWQPAASAADGVAAWRKGALSARPACDAGGTVCTFRLEIAPR
jgi:hypothetical protein